MDRRDFLKKAGIAAITVAASVSVNGEGKPMNTGTKPNPAAPCGLYCAICADYTTGNCHGCKCTCGKCIGAGHAKVCAINQCVAGKGLKSCSDCPEMPCTAVIQFTVDPVWRTHLQCTENLRRQKRIGIDAWLREQEAYWKDEKRLKRWRNLCAECERRANEERAGS